MKCLFQWKPHLFQQDNAKQTRLAITKKQQPCLESRLTTHRNYNIFKKFNFYYIFFYFSSLIGSKLKKKSVADNTLFPNHVHICIVCVRYMLKETFAITAEVEKRFIPKKTTTAAF